MTRPLWAPWRLEYVGSADEQEGCIFCLALDLPDEEGLVVRRGELAFALLNKFPYASGHLLVAPIRHVGEFGALEDDEALEIHRLASQGMSALAELYEPQGYNLGWNLGRIAGAGITDHVHVHLVPRWAGDTNFMPVLADVKVLPEHLAESRRKLAEAWPTQEENAPRRRGSNPRPSAWEADALPTELRPRRFGRIAQPDLGWSYAGGAGLCPSAALVVTEIREARRRGLTGEPWVHPCSLSLGS